MTRLVLVSWPWDVCDYDLDDEGGLDGLMNLLFDLEEGNTVHLKVLKVVEER